MFGGPSRTQNLNLRLFIKYFGAVLAQIPADCRKRAIREGSVNHVTDIKEAEPTRGSASFDIGGPSRTRTLDRPVMSREL